MFTLSEENYLKAIYHLEAFSGKGISTNAIAEKVDAKASSVTDMGGMFYNCSVKIPDWYNR